MRAGTPGAVWAFEYNVRSIGAGNTSFITDEYLVVEAAVFPAAGQSVNINTQKLTLRLNGRKEVLLTQTPAMVAASLKYPDWGWQRGAVAHAGVGDRGIILGRPQQVERFPGDNRPAQGRLPGPVPRTPSDPVPSQEQEPPIDLSEFLQKTALPEGSMTRPVSGYVYFPYKGKLEKIKTVELLIEAGGAEPVVVRLR